MRVFAGHLDEPTGIPLGQTRMNRDTSVKLSAHVQQGGVEISVVFYIVYVIYVWNVYITFFRIFVYIFRLFIRKILKPGYNRKKTYITFQNPDYNTAHTPSRLVQKD